MELKQGYKQTEVGLIPEDWGITELGKIGVFAKGSGVRKDQSNSGEIACVRYGELYTKHNNYIKTFHSFISKEVSLQAKKLKKGDILFAGSGETKAEIGKSAAFIDDIDAYAGGDIVILTPKEFDSLYLGYLLNASFIQTQKASRGQGDAVVHISSNNLSTIQIPQPPLTEQTAIANALSDMDAVISQTEKLIEKKKAIKQGAMQELLKPKEGWDKVTIGNVINVARGGSPRPIQEFLTSDPNGINWIKIGDTDIESKYIDSANEKIIPEGEKNSRKVNVGDFLLSNSMSFGRPYILNIDGCIHDGWLVLQNYNAHFDREFLYYSLMSSYVLKQYLRLAAGSGVLNLNKEIVKGVTLLKPRDLKEQRSIADILSTMDKDIDLQIKKLNKLKQQKQGMMQALLTGKIRLIS